MSGAMNLPDFGCIQIQFFMSASTDKMIKRLLSVPLRVVPQHAPGSPGGRQVVNNALNVQVKKLPSQIGRSGFQLTGAFKQVWKNNGLCVGFFYTHERLGSQEMELSPDVVIAFGDLLQSTWRYLHVWENCEAPGLLSVVCIDKSMRSEPEREVLVTGDHLDLFESKKGSPRKAKLEKIDKADMTEARRLLNRLKMS